VAAAIRRLGHDRLVLPAALQARFGAIVRQQAGVWLLGQLTSIYEDSHGSSTSSARGILLGIAMMLASA
jgi:hypothetical protein